MDSSAATAADGGPTVIRRDGCLLCRVSIVGGPADGRVVEAPFPVVRDLVHRESGRRYGFYGWPEGRPTARLLDASRGWERSR